MNAPAAGGVPLRPADLSAEWLSACLRQAGVIAAPTRVCAFEATRIGIGQGFAGQLLRLALRYEPPAPSAPATLVGKFASEHAPTRAMMATMGAYTREVRFYREFAAHAGIGVARCYFAHYEAREQRFCLLLEDLAPAATIDREQGLSLEQAKLVLTELARFHAHWWNRTEELPWLAVSPELARSVAARYRASLPRFVAVFGERFPTTARVGALVAVLLEGEEFIAIARKPPLTLAHNDLHLDNIFMPTAAGGRFALIDWQSVTASRHGISDVTRLLSVGLLPALRRQHQSTLLAHYHAELRRSGVRGYSLPMLKWRYRQELIAMVIVAVLALDTLDFAQGGGAEALALVGGRGELALVDSHVALILRPFMFLYRVRRGLRRLFGIRS